MESDIIIEFAVDHIVMRHPPGFTATPATVSDTWAKLADACEQHSCSRVLVIGQGLQRKLETPDVFESGIQAAGIRPGMKVAFCLFDYQPDDASRFFKTVALNRGTEIEFFSDESEAREWLLDTSAKRSD